MQGQKTGADEAVSAKSIAEALDMQRVGVHQGGNQNMINMGLGLVAVASLLFGLFWITKGHSETPPVVIEQVQPRVQQQSFQPIGVLPLFAIQKIDLPKNLDE
jgi:hypothetical protein